MEISMTKTRSADFCADRIDVITNFAVITNAVIKRVHCTLPIFIVRWDSKNTLFKIQKAPV